MRSRRVRRAAAVVAAGLLVGVGSPATAGHQTGQAPVTIEVEIATGNGAGGVAFVDPARTGDWHFVADVSGVVDEVFVQLWKPQGNRCAGQEIAGTQLSGSDAKPYHRRDVPPGTYGFALPSNVDGEHCLRVLLWGQVGAKVVVDAYEPAPAEPPLLSILPST